MKVDLKKIIEGIEFQGDESRSYLKLSSGEVVLNTDDAVSIAERADDYALFVELVWGERDKSLAEINARLADYIVSINGKLDWPKDHMLTRLGGAGKSPDSY